jgi:hypothetical protein
MNLGYALFGIVLAFLAIQSVIMGCIADTSQRTPTIQSMGTVVHNESSGGYYEIVTNEGIRYYPIDPDVHPVHEGMYVYFEADPVNTQSSDDPKGIPIRISLIGEYVPPMDTAKITFNN